MAGSQWDPAMHGLERRAGSASRREAALGGYKWSPGLPRPDAPTTLIASPRQANSRAAPIEPPAC